MKKVFSLLIFSCLLISFCYSKSETINQSFNLAFVKEIYLNKGDKKSNKGEKEIRNFIGIFPKENDTITVYKLNNDLKEKPEKFSFWSKKNKNSNTIIIYCSASNENINIIFNNYNTISIENDIYTVNEEYYKYLKQNILLNGSILDLVFLLKDGYGDYAKLLEPLNKNWRNQKEVSLYKIISAKIKNKNYQTDDQFFNYKIDYNYTKNGVLKSVSGENSFNKKYINENKKYIHYSIVRSINERALVNEDLYINKKTLFDSIVGNSEQYSISKTLYYTKYQSKLKQKETNKKPKSVDEILIFLK